MQTRHNNLKTPPWKTVLFSVIAILMIAIFIEVFSCSLLFLTHTIKSIREGDFKDGFKISVVTNSLKRKYPTHYKFDALHTLSLNENL